MTTDDLFELFGGRAAIMSVTGARRNAVNHWRHEGVPYRHWPSLIEEAERRGLRGISFETLRETRIPDDVRQAAVVEDVMRRMTRIRRA